MENQKREFTGIWIPRRVVEDERLTWTERAVYGEISCYERCFMSNAFIANRIGVTDRQVRDIISKLKDYGYVAQVGFDGRHRFLAVQGGTIPPVREEVDFHAERKQTSMIDNSIDNNIDTSETKVSRVSEDSLDDIEMVKVDDWGEEIVPRFGKKDTSYLKVFAMFGEYPKSWTRNSTQIKSAKALLAERDEDKIKRAIDFYRKNVNKPFIPEISTPYDLDTKWEKLLEFRNKQHGRQL
jgi:hypothetical protein